MVRVGFVTCVRLGLSCMQAIYDAGGELSIACTLADDLAAHKAGRVFIDDFCGRREIPLAKCRNVNDPATLSFFQEARLDWLFIVGWSQIARAGVLTAPRLGVLGMHPTLLPEGRGRAAIPWAILRGLSQTGVSLFKLDHGIDTGPIIAQVLVPVAARETATTLYSKINIAHRTVLVNAWPDIAAGTAKLVPQNERDASVWPARTPSDGRIDATSSLEEADRLVRATTRPYPGAFMDAAGGRLRIWSAVPYRDSPPPRLVREGEYWRVPVRDGYLLVDDGELESNGGPD